MARNPHTLSNPAKIAEQQVQVYELKLRGYSLRRIAAETGMSAATVQNRINAEIAKRVFPVAEEVRVMEVERLDGWLARLEDRMEQGEDPVRVVPIAVKVSERRARLMGLDAPEKAAVTVATLPADGGVAAVLEAARGRAEARVAALREGE